jgi:apolipoprotein N-acyltransferase
MSPETTMSIRATLLWIVVAAVAFHLAYWSVAGSYLIGLYLLALVQLGRAETGRKAFYAGLLVGLLIAVGKLEFFWRIFSASAVALWLVYAFWIGLFTVLAHLCFRQFGRSWGWALLPFLWCGLEYFRSELYYLRFSWLTPGYALALNAFDWPFSRLGVYGVGFVLAAIATGAALLWRRSAPGAILLLLVGTTVVRAWGWMEQLPPNRPSGYLKVAGVQLEFPTEKQVCTWLKEVVRRHPEADLVVLSEYTFAGPIPDSVKAWCREQNKYLIVGGKSLVSKTDFYNTAFVISPAGEIIFQQPKAVPIQFFSDGLPAPGQAVWNSPWGKIGLCICYDLSYSRVTDRLIRQGARALIVPTMDVEDWGMRQHALHARIAPVRAAEYGVPIFRLASSGISQAVDSTGRVVTSAPCPGEGAIIAANLELGAAGRLPLDRWLAPLSSIVTGVVVLVLIASACATKMKPKPHAACQ